MIRHARRHLRRALFAAAVALVALTAPRAEAEELVYGSCVPATDYLTTNALPAGFKLIDEETKGAVKWKAIAGGQIADCKATFSAVKDDLMQGGLAIPTYVPNLLPSNAMLYSTVILGDDVVAAAGAGSESLLLNCPSCLEEYKALNAIPLSPYPGAASIFMCVKPIKSVEDLKGKRIRATGAAVDLVKLAGGVPVSATLPDTVSILQRGGIDCTYGVPEWLKTYSFGEFAKYAVDYPLGVLSHYKAVVWETGDDLYVRNGTQPGGTGTRKLLDDEVINARDYMNEGGKLLVAGQKALQGGWDQFLYNPLGATPPNPLCPTNQTSGNGQADAPDGQAFPCIIVSNDFMQYWLGAYQNGDGGAPGTAALHELAPMGATRSGTKAHPGS